MSFAFIEAEKASFPIHQMCETLGISQSGFFAWRDRPACQRQRQDMVYLAHIRTAFALSNGTYGSLHARMIFGTTLHQVSAADCISLRRRVASTSAPKGAVYRLSKLASRRRSKPISARWAKPSASLASVLFGAMSSAAFACLASMQIAGTPSALRA